MSHLSDLPPVQPTAPRAPSSSSQQSSVPKKRHACPTCSRAFMTSGHLARHMRVHTGERNYKCPFPGCETRCSQRDNLQQHYRIHLSIGSRSTSTSRTRTDVKNKKNPFSTTSESTSTSSASSTTSIAPSTTLSFSHVIPTLIRSTFSPAPVLPLYYHTHRTTHSLLWGPDHSHDDANSRSSASPTRSWSSASSSYNSSSRTPDTPELDNSEGEGIGGTRTVPFMNRFNVLNERTHSPTQSSYSPDFPASGKTDVGSQNKVLGFVGGTWRAAFNWDTGNVPDGTDALAPTHSVFKFYPAHSPDLCQPGEDDIQLAVETIGDHPVGLGGHSDVWKGRLKSAESSTYSLVAVKVLRQFGGSSGSNEKFRKHLLQEVRIWKLLDHESVAGFYGVAYNSNGAPALISPWYANGSADVYFEKHPDSNPMKIIWEIILGVEYLHESNIVHGDLKGGNVMVDDAGHAKLIDFGLSRLIDSATGATGLTMSTVSFSIRWCAPELVLCDNAQVTKATDVYACASTALQLLTGEVPYSSQRERTVLLTVMNKVAPGRPSSPLRYPITHLDELWELLEQCWTEASRRPSISEIKDRVRAFCP